MKAIILESCKVDGQKFRQGETADVNKAWIDDYPHLFKAEKTKNTANEDSKKSTSSTKSGKSQKDEDLDDILGGNEDGKN